MLIYISQNRELDDKIDLFAVKEVQDALYERLSSLESIALSINYIRTHLSKYKKGRLCEALFSVGEYTHQL